MNTKLLDASLLAIGVAFITAVALIYIVENAPAVQESELAVASLQSSDEQILTYTKGKRDRGEWSLDEYNRVVTSITDR